MHRYFLEVFYDGTEYAGFQVQDNANTIQAEVEKALRTYYRSVVELTGSSRTDAGVHALQNYFHFDSDLLGDHDLLKDVYHLNAILPSDIAIRAIRQVKEDSHCRFDATYRSYIYTIYQFKNPFLQDRGWYYPYKLDINRLNEAAIIVSQNRDFESFAKRNSQVSNFICEIFKSEWEKTDEGFIYKVSGNRFLRGMVRGLVATMLKVGRNKIDSEGFKKIIADKSSMSAEFASPAKGLCLVEVGYKDDIYL